MSSPDPKYSKLLARIERLERLLRANPLRRTSVERGQVRMYGSSELTIEGLLSILGQLVLMGDMDVLAGGQITVGGVVITPLGGGRIQIGPNIVLDSQTQTITVGTGAAKVVLNGTNGTIKAGNMTIDPTEGGGAIVFDNGAQLYSHETENQIEMFSGSTHVTVREHTLAVLTQERGFMLVDEGDDIMEPGIYPMGLPQGNAESLLGVDTDGRMVEVVGYGDGGGDTPPEPNPAGYVWPADPQLYGISDDFAEHVARGSLEPGVDVMTPIGAAIYAPGNGTVMAVHTTTDGAAGRYVTIRTTEGSWFRMLHLSSVAVAQGQTVAQGQILGRSGGSGKGSEHGYRPHVHITFWSGPSDTMPPFSATEDFQAYMLAA